LKNYHELEKKEELTVNELARLYGTAQPTVMYWYKKLKLPYHFNENGKVRIFRKDFDLWIKTKPKAGKKRVHLVCTKCGRPHVAKGLCMTCYVKDRRKNNKK